MLRVMSEKSEILYDKALDLIQAGNVPEGIAAIEESLMEDAEDPLTWRLYSVTLAAVGRGDDAAAAMAKAEGFGLGEIDSLLMKAAQSQVEGQIDAAISRFEDALELDAERFEIWAGYALALLQAGYLKDALEGSEKAVALGADEAQAWYARGRVLRLTGDAHAALPAFDKAVAADPLMAVAWHERGMVQVQAKDLAGAAKSFERVLELQPGDAAAAQALEIVRQQME